MPLILSSLADGVGTLALDHYEKRNALGADMIAEILSALSELEERRARVVVLRSASAGDVWSAGHDVSELPRAQVDPLPYDDPLERLIRAVRDHPAPVIAMVDGSVWGGACDLVVNCDIVIADEQSTFAITPAKLGLPYVASGLAHFMHRMPLAIVKEMFFSASPLTADRALASGLVNTVVNSAQLESAVDDLARTIASRSAEAVSAHKKMLNVLSESNQLSPDQFEYLNELRRSTYMGADYSEGVAAFLEKRAPVFKK